MQPCPQQVENVMQLLFSCVFIGDSSLNVKALFTKADPDMQDHAVGESFTSPQVECELRTTRDLCEHLVRRQAPYLLSTAPWVHLLAFWLRKLICFRRPPIYFPSLYVVPIWRQVLRWQIRFRHFPAFRRLSLYLSRVCYYIYPATIWLKLTTQCWVKDDAHKRAHSVYFAWYTFKNRQNWSLEFEAGTVVTLEKINEWKGHKDADGLVRVLFLNQGLIACWKSNKQCAYDLGTVLYACYTLIRNALWKKNNTLKKHRACISGFLCVFFSDGSTYSQHSPNLAASQMPLPTEISSEPQTWMNFFLLGNAWHFVYAPPLL